MRYILIGGIILLCFLFTAFSFYMRYKREKRSLWLGFDFLVVLFFFLLLLTFILLILEEVYVSGLAYTLLLLGAIALVICLAFFPLVMVVTLVITGVEVIKKEGAGLAHYLSLGLGIAYLVYLILWPLLGNLNKSRLLDFIYFYMSLVFTSLVFMFILYTVTNLLNLLVDKTKSYDAIIVLGSGLREGKEVTPLLAARVDRGIEAHFENPGSLLILSGGQGSDEKLAEAQAMSGYAMAQGVKEEDIIIEDRSTSTRENLIYSKELLDKRQVEYKNLLVVSTSYHVLRALLLARELGIDCDGRGARTRLYYSLNAFIREWIAFLVMKKKSFVAFYGLLFIVMTLGYGLSYYLNHAFF